jgi:hypothetical protein
MSVLKDVASHLMPGMTNENHRNISDRIARLWVEFPNPRHCEYEAHVLTTQAPCLLK